MSASLPEDQRTCVEGCDHPDGYHKWEIEPHPQGKFDVYVSDDDHEALQAAQLTVERLWDEMKVGDEVKVIIRMNKP